MKHVSLALALSLLTTMLLMGCGPSNHVRLLPPPPLDSSVLPAPNAPRVTVVNFADKRQDTTSLGARRDGSAFTTGDDVAQWLSKALADELARNGMQISYALNVDQARSANPDFLLTGELDECWLREASATEMSALLRSNYTLANRQKRVLRESLNSSQTRNGLPSSNSAQDLLLDTLRDLVKPMAHKIVQAIEAKK